MPLFFLSIIALATFLFVGFFAPEMFDRYVEPLGTRIDAFAKRKWAVFWIVIFTLVISATFSLFIPLPEPRVHDEFAYLLQADTFVHGRVSNPPHPFWQFFESFHILSSPVYVSKYPPGQAAFLALGQFINKPIYGVWLSTSVATAAVFWMLRALVRPRFAIIGAALVFANPQVLLWNWNFWGGSVALLGSALVFGAGFRWRRKHFSRNTSILLGVGLSLLAVSRPLEGLVVTLLLGVYLFADWIRLPAPSRPSLAGLLPAITVIASTLCLIATYNWKITGNPVVMPYAVYEKTYSINPVFLWQREQPNPIYHHSEMRRFYEQIAQDFRAQQTGIGFAYAVRDKLSHFDKLAWEKAGFFLLLPGILLLRNHRWIRCNLLLLIAYALVAFLPVVYSQPHYAAPVFPIFVIFGVHSLRLIMTYRIEGRRCGRFWAYGIVIAVFVWSITLFPYKNKTPQSFRSILEGKLQATQKKFLLFVKYGPKHNLNDEWVYNLANIDEAKIIWVRDMGPEQNLQLMNYYKDREVMLVEPDNRLVTDLSTQHSSKLEKCCSWLPETAQQH